VRGGDGAVRLDRDLDLDELAVRVGRGAEEANRLAGDGFSIASPVRMEVGWIVTVGLLFGSGEVPESCGTARGAPTGRTPCPTPRKQVFPRWGFPYIRSGASTPTRSRLRAMTAFTAVTSARRNPWASLSSTRWWW
jgi:hypothetical protein